MLRRAPSSLTADLPSSWLFFTRALSPFTPEGLAGAFDHFFPASAGFSISGRLATLDLRNEVDSSSLALRLTRSPSQASTPGLPPITAGLASCATISSHD